MNIHHSVDFITTLTSPTQGISTNHLTTQYHQAKRTSPNNEDPQIELSLPAQPTLTEMTMTEMMYMTEMTYIHQISCSFNQFTKSRRIHHNDYLNQRINIYSPNYKVRYDQIDWSYHNVSQRITTYSQRIHNIFKTSPLTYSQRIHTYPHTSVLNCQL